MTPRSFLIANGLIAAHQTPNAAGEFLIACPECRHDPAKFFINGSAKGVKCFHCGLGESWRKFQLRFQPPSPQEEALERFVRACEARLAQEPYLMTYLRERGLTDEVIASQRLGYCDNIYSPEEIDVQSKLAYDSGKWQLEGRIIIPYIEDSLVVSVRGRQHPEVHTDPKYKSLQGAKSLPYIPSKLDPDQPVILVEGELSAILLRQYGIQAIGIPGCKNFNPDWVSGLKHLYIAFDGDDPGQAGAVEVMKKVLEIRKMDLPPGYDVDEYITCFGIESFKILINKAVFYLQNKPQTDDRLISLVDALMDWAWSNTGTIGPKIEWAPRLNQILSGWSPGLYLLGAPPSVGKSKLGVKAIYQAAIENLDDTVAIYCTFDDSGRNTLSSFVALHTGVDINDVRSPKNNLEKDPVRLKEFLEAVETFKNIPNLIVRDSIHGKRVTDLKYFLKSLRAKYPNKKIVMFVDSLSKLIPDREKDEHLFDAASMSNVKAYLATAVKDMAIRYEIALISPTDLRKTLPGAFPTMLDLKDAVELGYEADVVMLLHSDMQQNGDNSVMTWVDEVKNKKEPIVEMHLPKCKITGNDKEIVMLKLLSRLSDMEELTKEETILYKSKQNN